MTFDRDDARDHAQEPERTPEQRAAVAKLEHDAELRQLATDALIALENPNDTLRPDLQHLAIEKQGRNDRLTNVGAVAIAEHIMEERAAFARAAQQQLIQESLPTPSHDGKIATSIAPFGPDEYLEFAHVAHTQDIARAGLSSLEDLDRLRQGAPLMGKNNPNIVIGPAPGDLHQSAEGYAQRRQHNPFEGCAVYYKKG